MGVTPWPLLTPSLVVTGEEGRDMGETLWPLLTRPGEEGRDMGATLWPLLTPFQLRRYPLGRQPGLCVGLVWRARRS